MPKEHKTIFGTTEKSNFILNMTLDTMYKIIRVMLVISMGLSVAAGGLWLFTGKLYAYMGLAMLTFSGFACALWFGISVWKSSTPFYKNISYFMAIALAILAIISTLLSYSKATSLFGNQGRFEGLLAIVSYIALFLFATMIGSALDAKKIIDVIIAVGLINAVVAALQRFGVLYTPFKSLFSTMKENVFLPTGFVGSPIFLATLLVICLALAMNGACFDASLRRRIYYYVSTGIFAAVLPLTHSLIAMLGAGLVLIITLGIVIVRAVKTKEKLEKNLFANPTGRFILSAVILMVFVAAVGWADKFSLLDRDIAWHDSFFYLFISGMLSNSYDGGLYETGWNIALDAISRHPLEGTGPDCLWAPQIIGQKYLDITVLANSLERPYNDYLHVAATRGIPSLVIYLALIILSIKRAFGSFKAFVTSSENWYIPAMITAVIAYLVVIFFGVSTIYVAPYFWILLGIMNNKQIKN